MPRQGGDWLYLAAWLDRCSRKIAGWNVRNTMSEDLVREALRGALVVRRPLAGLIIHSDQGSQYRATRFKAKLLDGGSFPGLAEAKLEISH